MSTLVKDASWPLVASIAVITVSPILQITTGQAMLYTLWPAILMMALWAIQRLNVREVGFTVSDSKSYLMAVGYPLVIIGCIALGAWAAHLVDLKDYSGATVFRRLSLNFLITFVLALITEEGFFRGALWGSCERAGFSPAKTLIWTSVAFGLWHMIVPLIDPDFAQPLTKVPQYVLGSTAFGVAMGLLRLKSGSIIVPSVCHALWNSSVYTFFGAGEKVGQLGIQDSTVWDPERGYAGLAFALLASALLWWWLKPATTPVVQKR